MKVTLSKLANLFVWAAIVLFGASFVLRMPSAPDGFFNLALFCGGSILLVFSLYINLLRRSTNPMTGSRGGVWWEAFNNSVPSMLAVAAVGIGIFLLNAWYNAGYSDVVITRYVWTIGITGWFCLIAPLLYPFVAWILSKRRGKAEVHSAPVDQIISPVAEDYGSSVLPSPVDKIEAT